MGRLFALPVFVARLLALAPSLALGQIHAMVNYETKSAESLKSLKKPISAPARKEGVAIIDVDPKSKTFGQIVQDLPLPGDLVAHHIFYNRDASKAYVTALGKGELRVIDDERGRPHCDTGGLRAQAHGDAASSGAGDARATARRETGPAVHGECRLPAHEGTAQSEPCQPGLVLALEGRGVLGPADGDPPSLQA